MVKRRDVLSWLKEHKYDVCCLQDLHCVENMESVYKSEWGQNCIFSSNTTRSRGVTILFGKNLDFKIHQEKVDIEGNYVILDVTVENVRMTLGSIYGPNTDDPIFYANLFDEIAAMNNATTMLCGDWNIPMDYEKDTRNYIGENNRKARDMLLQKMCTLELSDVWRVQHLHDKTYTWHKSARSLQMARLDYFLVSKDIVSHTLVTSIIPGYKTDHSAITLRAD